MNRWAVTITDNFTGKSEEIKIPPGIKYPKAFLNKFDINLFDDALPGKCTMSDIDAVAERRGKFIAIEFKTGQKTIPWGQQILIDSWVALKPENMHICLWWNGWHGNLIYFYKAEIRQLGKDTVTLNNPTLEDVKAIIRSWHGE